MLKENEHVCCNESTVSLYNVNTIDKQKLNSERANTKYHSTENKQYISCHITKQTDIYKSIIDCNAATAQLFLGSAHSYKRSVLSYNDITRSEKYILDTNFHLYTHAPYILSLGNADLYNKTCESVIQELEQVSQIKGRVVIHPNSGNITNAINALNNIPFSELSTPFKDMLLLENSCREGDKLGRSLFELGKIIHNSINSKYVGICIDTCHIFAAGNYDLSIPTSVDNFFYDVNHYIGLDKLHMIHLNDSKNTYGSFRDTHELIGKGEIWREKLSKLQYFISETLYRGIDLITETGGGIEEVTYLRSII